MAYDIKDGAAAAAARAAAEAAARRAAQEAAARAAAAAQARAAAAQQAQKKPAAAPLKADEMSTGKGGALRLNATQKLGATGLAQAQPAATTPSTTTASTQPLTFKVNAFGVANFKPAATTPAATTPATVDDPEERRAQAERQRMLDANTAGLPPDQAKKVQDAANVVNSAGNGIGDPAARAKAVADAINQQSAQFKGDPKSSQAFANSIGSDVEAVGTDVGNSSGDGKSTAATMQSLAQACDNLGPTASMNLGHQLANGLPNTSSGAVSDALESVGENSDGGRALLFGTAQGAQLNGNGALFDSLKQPMNLASQSVQPADFNAPLDPNDPDVVGKAQLQLAESRWGNAANVSSNDDYLGALSLQQQQLASNPAVLQQVMQSQRVNIEDAMNQHAEDGSSLNTVFRAAQAEGNGELDRLTKEYASQRQNSNIANDLDPSIAKSMAFAFRDAGKPEDATNFAARAATTLDGATSRAKDANDKVGELQDKLDKELASVGPGLDKTQRAAYEQKFWAENQGALDEQKAASADLHQQLNDNLADLNQLASLNPAAGNAVGAALKELSNDPSEAKFVQDTVASEKMPVSNSFPPGFEGAEEDLVTADANATNTLAHQALVKGDEAGAVEQLNQLHEFLENTNFATNEVKEFVEKGLPALKEFTSLVSDAVKTHDLSKVTDYLKTKPDELEASGSFGGGLGSLLSTVTKSVGVAAYLNEAAHAPDGKTQVLDVMNATQASSELIASGFTAISEATKEATNTALKFGGEALGDLADVLDKINPVTALGISLVSGFSDLSDAMKNPNVKTVGAAVGDTLTSIGAAAALFPGGEALGGAIAFTGAAVSIVSNFVQGILDDNARKDDAKQLLRQVYAQSAADPASPLYGMTADQYGAAADRMVDCGTNLGDFASNAGLTPDQVVKIAANTPEMNNPLFGPMADVARLSGLKGQAFVDYVSQLESQGLEDKLDDFASLGGVGGAQSEGNAEVVRWDGDHEDLTDVQQRVDGENAAYRKGYDDWMNGQLRNVGLLP